MVRYGNKCAIKTCLDQGIIMIFFDDVSFIDELMTWIYSEAYTNELLCLLSILLKIGAPVKIEDAFWIIKYDNYRVWVGNCMSRQNLDDTIPYNYVIYIPDFVYTTEL